MNEETNPNSVLIVSAGDHAFQLISQVLPPSHFSPLHTAATVGEAKRLLVDRSFDIVIVNTPLPDEFGVQFAIDSACGLTCGLLLLVKGEVHDSICQKVEQYGILTLPKTVSRQMIYQSAKLLAATGQKIKAMEQKTMSLEKKMEEIQLVNRAKLLLVEHLSMSEPEAHRYIEKRAMDACVKRREIAETIIITYKNRGEL